MKTRPDFDGWAPAARVAVGWAVSTLLFAACSRSSMTTSTVEIPLPVAPESARVDLEPPVFSNPRKVDNPLFPVGGVPSVVMLGTVDGEPFRVEVTVLPNTKTIQWNGQIVALESQYMALVDGRIAEVALDWYAQADDGSVWYLGEDVFNYEDGALADTEGTWVAGQEGPGAMIMPANPKVGDVYRPENAYPLVFEEVTVKEIGNTVQGPHGPVNGAIVVDEFHMDSTHEAKTFAPGYGEFITGSGADLEAVALAIPTDARSEPVPAELTLLKSAALEIFDILGTGDWDTLSASADSMLEAFEKYRSGGLPPMLETQMDDALGSLEDAIAATSTIDTGQAAIDIVQATLDFELQYRLPIEIEQERFGRWVRQVILDVEAGDLSLVHGDLIVLDWVLDRFAHLDQPRTTRIQASLAEISGAAQAEDLAAVGAAAAELLSSL